MVGFMQTNLGGDLIRGWKSCAWKYYFLLYWLAALQAALQGSALFNDLKREIY